MARQNFVPPRFGTEFRRGSFWFSPNPSIFRVPGPGPQFGAQIMKKRLEVLPNTHPKHRFSRVFALFGLFADPAKNRRKALPSKRATVTQFRRK